MTVGTGAGPTAPLRKPMVACGQPQISIVAAKRASMQRCGESRGLVRASVRQPGAVPAAVVRRRVALKCYSGIAPVKEASGNSEWVHFRRSCPKFLRQTFHEFAFLSTRSSAWAKASMTASALNSSPIPPQSGLWLTSGSGSSFAAGKRASFMTSRSTCNLCKNADPLCGPRTPRSGGRL
jgi:Transposase IS116/IS110/IS902 family